METAVIKERINDYQWLGYAPAQPIIETKKKSFEEACAECNAVTVDKFIDELRSRIKERYKNAKSQDI